MLSLESPLTRIGPWVMIATLVLAALVAGLAWDAGVAAGRLGGDFPSFYAAGNIVLDGNGSLLYDATVQQTAQSQLLENGGFLFFAYPPFTAAAYGLVSWMPFGLAFGVHTLLAIAALVGSLIAIRPMVRGYLDGYTRLGVATVACLAAYPVIRSVMGGQNATFTLLGFALVARFDHEDRHLATGAAAAALLYKPQFGLLVIVILVVGRRWRAVVWTVAFAAVLYAIGIIVFGGEWLSPWLAAVSDFGPQNLEVNGPLMISAWGWFDNLIGVGVAATLVGGTVVAVTTLPFLFAILTHRWTGIPWYAAAPVVIVAAPSALYYDATLTVVTVMAMLAWIKGVHWLVVVAIIGVTWSEAAALSAGWSPLFIPIVVAAGAFALAGVRSPSPLHNP
jgi:hypothetical protein